MNIELEIKDIKHDLNYAKKCEYDHVTLDVYKVQTLLIAYEKEKEKNKEKDKFEKILADDLKRHIESITIGKSITFPCGWVYKKDLLDLINDIKWEE